MAETSPITQVLTDFLNKNLTRTGVIGGLGYFCCQIALAKTWRDAVQSLGYLFLLLIPAGAAFRAKRAADMTATAAADSAISRAVIANAVTPADVPNVIPSSSDKTIQREIEKQLGGPAAAPK